MALSPAERARNYRARRRHAGVTGEVVTPSHHAVPVTVSTSDMIGLASHLSAPSVTRDDIERAGELVLTLARMLPPDSSVGLVGLN